MLAAAVLASGAAVASAVEARALSLDRDGNMLLINESLRAEPVRVTELTEHLLLVMDAEETWQRLDPSEAIALIDENARRSRRAAGLAILADGQQIPGVASPAEQHTGDGLGWRHQDLGQITLPLEALSVVLLERGATAPPAGASDVLVLTNGDVRQGFIIDIGDPVVIEETDADGNATELRVPLDRVAAMRIVNTEQESSRTRVWLTDGTVTDVQSIAVQDDGYVRLRTRWNRADGNRDEIVIRMEELAAILLNPGRMTPLASLRVTRVEGPATRFVIPPPRVLDDDAALGLAGIEFRGPLTVHYALPENADRFAAEAVLPETARTWGDYELVIRVDGDTVFHETLNADTPRLPIAFDIDGSELTIELLEGVNGPVQDHLVLKRAMIGLSGQ